MQNDDAEQEVIEIEDDVILPVYRDLLHEPDEYSIEFLYGGRDSAKSYTTAQLLIIECLSLDYFRCALIRDVFGSIKDSQWQLIKDIVEAWGLLHKFTFTKAPLEIICDNGNKFISRGCDEPQNLKSITACNRAWIEEGITESAAFTVVLTTLRSTESKVRIFYTFNPECKGNYQNFWLYQDWFAGHDNDCSFIDERKFKVMSAGREKEVSIKYRVTHSTYHDNPYVSDERIAFHENNKGYYYTVYTLGRWGYKITGGEFWTQLKAESHVTHLPFIKSPIYVSLDNNVNPYVSVQVWQVDNGNKCLNQFAEIICKSPDNSSKKAAIRLIQWLKRHDYSDVIYVGGDASANNHTTVDENNASFFDKFIEVLQDEGYHVVSNVGRSNPRVQLSGEFINEIFEVGYDGWSIKIDESCQSSIEDYTMAKKDKDGTILKKRITDKETGQSYEQYGHLSDCMRYLVCTVLKDEFQEYSDRGRRKLSYD